MTAAMGELSSTLDGIYGSGLTIAEKRRIAGRVSATHANLCSKEGGKLDRGDGSAEAVQAGCSPLQCWMGRACKYRHSRMPCEPEAVQVDLWRLV